jgi:N utilization substance protein A
VIIDETNNLMEVIVPDEFLSIAIGKKGQNVRLASKLTGWHLDVKSETRYNEAMQTGYDSLVALPGVGISLADALYESGFYSAEEISEANIEDLVQIRGIGEEKAVKLLEAAQQAALIAASEADSEPQSLEASEEVEADASGDDEPETSDQAEVAAESSDENEPEAAGEVEVAAESSDESEPEAAGEVEVAAESSDEGEPEAAGEAEVAAESSDESEPEAAGEVEVGAESSDEGEPEKSDEAEPEEK